MRLQLVRHASPRPIVTTSSLLCSVCIPPRTLPCSINKLSKTRRRRPPPPAASSPPSASPSEVCSILATFPDVPGPLADELADLLLAEGATSASVEEFRPPGSPEQQIYAHNCDSSARVWDRCTVKAWFPLDATEVEIKVCAICDALALPSPPPLSPVRMADWETAIKDSFQPILVGPSAWVVPTWASPPDPHARMNLAIEPGLAFGTGGHDTTRLCLAWLVDTLGGDTSNNTSTNNNSKIRVMDYGTGSGVLAVAALLLGAGGAVGVDVETLAVKAALSNAGLNGVEDRLVAVACDADDGEGGGLGREPLEGVDLGRVLPDRQSPHGAFDIVVANILQGPLIGLAPRLAGYAAPGAVLGLSGILSTQAPAVIDAYRPFFTDFSVTTLPREQREGEAEWALVTAVRR